MVMDKSLILQRVTQRADKVWHDFTLLYPQLIRFNKPTIQLNGRFTKTAGRCWMETNHIEIGTKFVIAHYDQIMGETIPHEIAHQIDFNLNGTPRGNRWHGPTWQRIMQSYGLPPETYHSMDV
jgi:predicted SprT family Zn-dependent metalloprotease